MFIDRNDICICLLNVKYYAIHPQQTLFHTNTLRFQRAVDKNLEGARTMDINANVTFLSALIELLSFISFICIDINVESRKNNTKLKSLLMSNNDNVILIIKNKKQYNISRKLIQNQSTLIGSMLEENTDNNVEIPLPKINTNQMHIIATYLQITDKHEKIITSKNGCNVKFV